MVPPTLFNFLCDAFESIDHAPNGRRYDDLKPLSALVSFFGKHARTILERTLIMPSYKIALSHRNELFRLYGFDEYTFDGSIEKMNY